MTLEEADEMIDVCRREGVLLMYAEELFFTPKYVRAKQMADEGAFGKVYLVKQSEKHSGPHGDWFWDVERVGRRRVDGHGLPRHRLLLLVPGPPDDQERLLPDEHPGPRRQDAGARTSASCILEFENGPSGSSRIAGRSAGGMDDRVEVFGDAGLTYANLQWATPCRPTASPATATPSRRPRAPAGWSYPVFEELWNYGFPQEMRHFARCVRRQGEPRSPPARTAAS